jgi:hypothetical protein
VFKGGGESERDSAGSLMLAAQKWQDLDGRGE